LVVEGAKAAAQAHYIVDKEGIETKRGKREDNPWQQELSEFEIWGAIGGAYAVERLDFDELRKMNPENVVYFCDNDKKGRDALSTFSEKYGGKTRDWRFRCWRWRWRWCGFRQFWRGCCCWRSFWCSPRW
jgi:hypothetical protein